MGLATLIISILTLLATILFPCISLLKNRLRFQVSIMNTEFRQDNSNKHFHVTLEVKNKSKYPVTIHKILLITNYENFFAYCDHRPLKNRVIDEHEEVNMYIVFGYNRNVNPNVVGINIYTNKKNYYLPISVN